MEKFTKGEWKFTISKNGVRQISSVISSQICKLWNNKETVANAHLIAAAPDMYKLLKEFYPMDEDGNGNFEYNEGSEYFGEQVIALLKKARGE